MKTRPRGDVGASAAYQVACACDGLRYRDLSLFDTLAGGEHTGLSISDGEAGVNDARGDIGESSVRDLDFRRMMLTP